MRKGRERDFPVYSGSLSLKRKTGSGTVARKEERDDSLSIPSSTHELSIFLSSLSFGETRPLSRSATASFLAKTDPLREFFERLPFWEM